MYKPTLEEILKKADELGIKYEYNTDKSGIFIIDSSGNEREATFEDIFEL